MTAACEVNSQYYKIITIFCPRHKKPHLPLFAMKRRYFYSVIFHRKIVKLAGRLLKQIILVAIKELRT